MIKIFFLIGFLNIEVFAQSNSNFNQAIDLINFRIVEYSLGKTIYYNDFHKEFNTDIVNKTRLNIFLTKIHASEFLIKLTKEVDLIKEVYTVDDTVKFLTEDIFKTTRYPLLYKLANDRKNNKYFSDFLMNLKSEIKYFLLKDNNRQKPEIITKDTTFTKSSANIDKNISENNKSFKEFFSLISPFINFLLIILIVVNLCSAYYLIRSINHFRYSKRDISPDISFDSYEIRNTIKELNCSIKEIKAHFMVHEEKLMNLFSDLKASRPIYNNITDNSKSSLKNIPCNGFTIEHKSFQPHYLSTPNPDGYFNDNSITSNIKYNETFYRLEKITNKKANVFFESNESSVKMALQFPERIIDPVCFAVNAYKPKSKDIHTVKPGEMELIDNKWVVLKKVMIAYE